MPYWRDKSTWIPLYLLLAGFLCYHYRLKGLYFVLAVALTIGIADQISSEVIKKNIVRLRPCNDVAIKDQVQLLVPCGSGYSFTSSHAANHFAIATFIALTLGQIFRWMRWPLFLWAASIAYGQVYVGVHYPLDVLCGGLLGALVGWAIAKLYLRWEKIAIPIPNDELLEDSHPSKG